MKKEDMEKLLVESRLKHIQFIREYGMIDTLKTISIFLIPLIYVAFKFTTIFWVQYGVVLLFCFLASFIFFLTGRYAAYIDDSYIDLNKQIKSNNILKYDFPIESDFSIYFYKKKFKK